jgi:sugar phosphate isomerase/epimerase
MTLDADTPIAICVSTLIDDPVAGCTPAAMTAAVDAAAAAGFASVSVWSLHATYLEAAGFGVTDLAALVADRGLTVVGVEAVTAWAGATDADAVRVDVDAVLDLAEELGAPDVLAVTMDEHLGPWAVDHLGLVADRAAARDRRVGLEFLPWSAVRDLPTAIDLLDAVDRPNLGLTVDAWHWHRAVAGSDPARLATIDPSRIVQLQLDDVAPGPAGADLMAETMAARLPPGEGVADLSALVHALRSSGASPVVCAEVFNATLLAESPETLARRTAEGCRRVLTARPSVRAEPGPHPT